MPRQSARDRTQGQRGTVRVQRLRAD